MRIIFNHRRRSEDGQALLLSVLLIALIAIMIPAINSVLQLRNQWTTSSLDSNMALRAAYAGVAQASSLLGANAAVWNGARGDNDPAHTIVTPASFSGPFKLADKNATFGLQMNSAVDIDWIALGIGPRSTVEVCVTGQYNNAKRALHVGYRSRGLGLRLSNGMDVSATAMLGSDPGPAMASGNFAVYWGPMVVYNNITMPVGSEMEAEHSPRKFATGFISPRKLTADAPTTDNREYWAFANLGTPPTIDVATYQAWADATVVPGGGTGHITGPVTFSAGHRLEISPYGTDTLYITGDATFTDPVMSARAMIVTGRLTLNTPASGDPAFTGSGWPPPEAQFTSSPTGFWREYPMGYAGTPFPGWNPSYNTVFPQHCWDSSDPSYPCRESTITTFPATTTNIGTLLGTATNPKMINIHGFVWANDLTVANGIWVIDGALRVDGQLTIAPGAKLYVVADDYVSQNVMVTPLEVQPAFTFEIPPGQFHPTIP